MLTAVQRPSVHVSVLTVMTALLLPGLVMSVSSPARAQAACAASAPAGSYEDGDGLSVATAFEVATVAHLLLLATDTTNWDKHFVQKAHIDLAGCAWTPIGSTTTPFRGSYVGDEFEIRGLTLDGGVGIAGDNQGFFGRTGGGASLVGVRLVDVSVKGRDNVGALVGNALGTRIENSSVMGDSRVEGRGRVGGLVGNKSQFAFAGPPGSVPPPVPPDAVVRGASAADVTGENNVGGLVGRADLGALITEGLATGSVDGQFIVGGLVGNLATGARVERSFATGDATTGTSGSEGYDGGGLVGELAAGSVVDSFATSSVRAQLTAANGDARIGGLVGRISSASAVIERSYSSGPVSAPQSPTPAGLVGGLVGFGPPSFDLPSLSFWDVDTSGQAASVGGTGVQGASTVEMRTLGTFAAASWAIVAGSRGGSSDVWGICPLVNDGYPFLLWTVAESTVDPCVAVSVAVQQAALSFVAPGGVLPLQSPGLGEWVQSDGSSEPLAASSPGVNQVRYSADGIQVTFTGGAGSGVSRGLVANPAGEVVCEICVQLSTGGVIEAWMFSEPRLVAAWRVEDLPCQTFAIPVVAPLDGGGPLSAGAHTLQLALPTASGMQAVNVGVTVGGPVPGSVPAGEGPAVPGWLLAFALLASAGAVVAVRRQVVAG